MNVQIMQSPDSKQSARIELARLDTKYRITGLHQQSANDDFPMLRGFVRSPFSPLVYHSTMQAAEQAGLTNSSICPDRKGIILSSMFIDGVSEEEQWKDLLEGRKVSPMMFPQTVPSSIIGFINKDLSIHGPMTCISPSPYADGLRMALQQAADWMEDGDADLVMVVFCDVPLLRAKQWALDEAVRRKHALEFCGGAVSFVLETAEHAHARGAASHDIVRELYERLMPEQGLGSIRFFWK